MSTDSNNILSQNKTSHPDIIEVVEKYISVVSKEKYPRYSSWDFCHKAFGTPIKDNTHVLQLAVYLASWGMYRGSSGILQKNYLVHEGAVDILFSKKYRNLKCNQTQEVSSDDVDDIIDLKSELSAHYKSIYFTRGLNPFAPISPTDTLISKIILGTYGCVPAYDQYFIKGLKEVPIKKKEFNEESLLEIFAFIVKHKDDFQGAHELIFNKTHVHYPIMKLVDMYFWQLGYDLALEEEMKKEKAKRNNQITP